MDRGHDIYHIVPQSEFRGTGTRGYECESLDAEGFIHCSGTADQVLRVANALFADMAEPLPVLRIDTSKLSPPLKWEPADNQESEGLAEDVEKFPHVYGPIDLRAITGVGALSIAQGSFVWPGTFGPTLSYLR